MLASTHVRTRMPAPAVALRRHLTRACRRHGQRCRRRSSLSAWTATGCGRCRRCPSCHASRTSQSRTMSWSSLSQPAAQSRRGPCAAAGECPCAAAGECSCAAPSRRGPCAAPGGCLPPGNSRVVVILCSRCLTLLSGIGFGHVILCTSTQTLPSLSHCIVSMVRLLMLHLPHPLSSSLRPSFAFIHNLRTTRCRAPASLASLAFMI